MDKQTAGQFSLKSIPTSVRVLFTAYLLTMGVGYFMAFLYLFLIDVKPHQKMGMDVLQGTIHKYYGKRGDSRLESALNGGMGDYVSLSEKEKIFRWVKNGALKKTFTMVEPIFENNCSECHSSVSGLEIVSLTTFEEIKRQTVVDFGESIKTLARVSHVHFFGISFIFISTGLIFSLSSANYPLKIVVILTPFIAIWLDIGSWWFTKYKPVFAYTVITGGALAGIAFTVQVFYSLYEMWLKKR